jgi:hypothetical protein
MPLEHALEGDHGSTQGAGNTLGPDSSSKAAVVNVGAMSEADSATTTL